MPETKHPQMRSTVFGEVLAEILEARDIPVTPFNVGKLAEDAGLDGWKVLIRTHDIRVDLGQLDVLAGELEFSDLEITRLAKAYIFEERIES